MNPQAEPAIDVQHLTRRFRKKVALNGATLTVPKGCVYGLVGENGAGKTTLIRCLLGLLKPHEGTVRVFGKDPVEDPEGVLSRIGFLSEDRDLPEWMRVDELMWYTQAFYPKWDEAFALELRETFNLDPAAKIRHLSRGERAKAGLLVALAHRPDLLLLDEPSSGLDPVVRRHILSAIIRTVADEGRTVLFSSHLLDEVERVADRLAMIRNGEIVLTGSLDEIKANHHRIVLAFDQAQTALPPFQGAISITPSSQGMEWTVICDGRKDAVFQSAREMNARILEEATPSLEEIFAAHAGEAPTKGDDA
jgi:ABC-2 type transport system ATP-binding protein